MTRYVWRGQWLDPRTGTPMDIPVRDGPCTPMVRSDIEDYTSPIDGSVIRSRSGQRYDLAKNDCVIAPPTKRPFVREEYVERKARQAQALAAHRAK